MKQVEINRGFTLSFRNGRSDRNGSDPIPLQGMGQTARDIRGAAAVVPLAGKPAPRVVIDPPLADQLALGRVVVQGPH
jgi:Family of unknown function (DUF6130)